MTKLWLFILGAGLTCPLPTLTQTLKAFVQRFCSGRRGFPLVGPLGFSHDLQSFLPGRRAGVEGDWRFPCDARPGAWPETLQSPPAFPMFPAIIQISSPKRRRVGQPAGAPGVLRVPGFVRAQRELVPPPLNCRLPASGPLTWPGQDVPSAPTPGSPRTAPERPSR